jgi:hypothetical protein
MSPQDVVTFVATFLGAFLGLGLTYLYDRYKIKKSESEDRQKMIRTICHELARNLRLIETTLSSAKEYAELANQLNENTPSGTGYLAAFPDVRLERAAIDTAIFSGRLFLLDQKTFEEVSEQYRRVDVVNLASSELRAIARAPVNKDYLPMIQSLRGTSAGTMENLLKSIPAVLASLETEA